MDKGKTRCALNFEFLESFCSKLSDIEKLIKERIANLEDLLSREIPMEPPTSKSTVGPIPPPSISTGDNAVGPAATPSLPTGDNAVDPVLTPSVSTGDNAGGLIPIPTVPEVDKGPVPTPSPSAGDKEDADNIDSAEKRGHATEVVSEQAPSVLVEAGENPRRKKLEEKLRRSQEHLRIIQDFGNSEHDQVSLISEPFLIPERNSSGPLATPAGLFCIYHDKVIERNFNAHEAIIVRLTRP